MSACGRRALPAVAFLAAVLAPSLAAPQERFVDARVSTQPAGMLASTVASLQARSRGPEWIGYVVPGVAEHRSCCGDSWGSTGRECGTCRLEESHAASRGWSGKTRAAPESPVRLEAPSELVVLLRVEGGGVDRVRVFDGACSLDAGGLAVHWLTGVAATESLGLLAGFVDASEGLDRETVSRGALTAIALHADGGADAFLDRFSGGGEPMELRKQAAFWMGVARGRRGLEGLRRLAHDPRPAIREHVTFALTQSREPEALDLILHMAHDDTSPRVRGQALFWLAQKAGQKAVVAISQAIEDDPGTDVKTRAVFALSQLPPDEGIPLLIQQARTNRNAEVRKRALFWLGQSGDPRALALFEQILTR